MGHSHLYYIWQGMTQLSLLFTAAHILHAVFLTVWKFSSVIHFSGKIWKQTIFIYSINLLKVTITCWTKKPFFFLYTTTVGFKSANPDVIEMQISAFTQRVLQTFSINQPRNTKRTQTKPKVDDDRIISLVKAHMFTRSKSRTLYRYI